jgi:hypothetical protein
MAVMHAGPACPGIDLVGSNGHGSNELPVAASFIVDSFGRIARVR